VVGRRESALISCGDVERVSAGGRGERVVGRGKERRQGEKVGRARGNSKRGNIPGARLALRSQTILPVARLSFRILDDAARGWWEDRKGAWANAREISMRRSAASAVVDVLEEGSAFLS